MIRTAVVAALALIMSLAAAPAYADTPAPAPTTNPTDTPSPEPTGTPSPEPTPTDTPTPPPPTPQTLRIGSLSCVNGCQAAQSFVSGHGSWRISGTTQGVAPGTTVEVYLSFEGGPWTRSRTTTVDASGAWRVADRAVVSTGGYRWAATLGGSPDAPTSTTSPVVSRTVMAPAIAFRSSGPASATASRMALRGTINPALSGRRVTIQRYTSGTWRNVATVTTGRGGSYGWTTTLGKNTLSTYTFRARYTSPHSNRTVHSTRTVARRVMPAAHVRLTHSQARSILASKGIGVRSSRGCTTRTRYGCTSLETIRSGTLSEAISIRDAGCAVTVTGGTEVGHAHGTYSHWNGYKIDLAMSSCVTRQITRKARPSGRNLWYAAPTRFFYERHHWDLRVVP